MKINIKATNTTLTPAISEYIEKKLDTLNKFFREEDCLVNVEVGKTTQHHKSGDIFKAEVRVNSNGEEYYANVETEDLYAAIDKVKDEITRELTSKRKKTLRLFRKGSAKVKNILKGFTGGRS
jgi:putative sigma-54 modulation protein